MEQQRSEQDSSDGDALALALRCARFCSITPLGEERANLSAFLRLFDLCLFGFVGFLFLLVSGKGCGLWFIVRAL